MVLGDKSTNDQEPRSGVNKYEKSIDFQNNCRSFYLNRVKATETFKQKMCDAPKADNKEQKKTSLSTAMDRLRAEMTSLVDQDLSLMKQLLTLNETIEELKNKRLYGVSKDSLDDSSGHLGKSVSMLSINSESSAGLVSEDDTELQGSASYKWSKNQDSEDSGYGE